MKKTLLYMALMTMFCCPLLAGAQGMSINTTGSTADASAMLDVSSTTQGMLVPRMTAAQISAIATPATGLLVYQTDGSNGFYYNSGTPASPSWTMVQTPITLTTTGTSGAATFSGGTLNVPQYSSDAYTVITASQTAVAGTNYILNGNSVVLTLPSSPAAGATVKIVVAVNGSTGTGITLSDVGFNGTAGNYGTSYTNGQTLIAGIDVGASIIAIYTGSSWMITE